jgi:hypothetical protein
MSVYDLILSIQDFYPIKNKTEILQDYDHCLNDKGMLIIATNVIPKNAYLSKKFAKWCQNCVTMFQRIELNNQLISQSTETPENIHQKLKDAGFRSIEMQTTSRSHNI